jgi:2-haloacid dehalogenase
MLDINPVPKIITFDCYGTLVQWREVLVRELADMLREAGRDESESVAMLDAFSKFSHELTTAKPHRIYKDVLRIGFRKALEAHKIAATDERVERIAQSIRTMGPHPEVPEVLRKLRSRYKVAG